jgi:hypothetical protein
MQSDDERIKIGKRSEDRIDAAIIGDVIAEISHWRGVDRREPHGTDTEPHEIIDPPSDDAVASPLEIAFSSGPAGSATERLINLLSEDHSTADDKARHHVLLEAYGYRWYRVGGLDYLLVRSNI